MIIVYDDIVEKYKEVLKYAIRYSDTFAVITELKRPYSKIPPNCKHDEVMKNFEEYLVKQVVRVREWPGTNTSSLHKVMNVYKACRATRDALLELPNIFLALENNLPEDICFYRNEKLWIGTISHEKMAGMKNETKEDIAFLENQNIIFYLQ